MSVALRHPISLAEFLDWEERQDLRWEFDGFEPVAMTGGSFAHETIGHRLRSLLELQLAGKRCRVLGPTLKVEVAGRIRYPDAFVFCSPVSGKTQIIKDPIVVFEVVSPSISRTDRIEKPREYQATPSIQRYIILEQDSIAATIMTRIGDVWAVRSAIEGDTLSMPEIEAEIPLADLYAGLDLEPLEPDEDPRTAQA